MRTLEVVVLNEQRHPPLAIVEVGEHRARQELLPQGLPEALDLAAGLGMVRAALHMPDALAPKLLLEVGRAPPCGVLPPLIGEDLPRGPIVRDASRERLHDERAPLVVSHHQTHKIAGVVIQERRNIDPLVFLQQEREQVGLPQLIGFGPLEAPRCGWRIRLSPDPLLREPLPLQHPSHRRLGGADADEAPEHVPDAPGSRTRMGRPRRQDRITPRVV